jgi:hypothetical protein
MLTAQGRVND